MIAASALGLLAWSPPAFALNPSADVSQYAHTAWKIRDGFISNKIVAIAQTQDGYLWFGTDDGLLRFDGVKIVSWQPPAGMSLPSTYIRSLLSSRDGTLWIGTISGLVSWKDRRLTEYPALAGVGVDSLVEDRAGTVWAGGTIIPSGRVCAIRRGNVTCDGDFGRWVTSLYESGGYVWVAADTGLWRWAPDTPRLYRMQDPVTSIPQALADDGTGGLLVATDNGLRQFAGETDAAIALPATHRQQSPTCVLRDRHGGVWVGTRKGLLHIHEGRLDVYARTDGLSGDVISRLFEDREGNVWVATTDGFDRFRDYAAITISGRQGLPEGAVGSVLGARGGSVWFNSGGRARVSRWRAGQLSLYRSRGLPDAPLGSLFEDARGRIWISSVEGIGYVERDQFVTVKGIPGGAVNAIVEDAQGTLWVANWDLGLIRMTSGGAIQRIPWSDFSRQDPASRVAVDPVQGGLWLGFTRGGLAYWADGRVRASYAALDGFGSGRVNDLRVDRDGTLWAATEGGLSRVKDGRIRTMTSRNGLPCNGVDSILDDGDGAIWLYLTCGIARLARDDLEAWAAAAANDSSATPMIRATVLDSSDGIRSVTSVSSYSPHTARSSDGKLWFATLDGVSVVDPRRLPVNNLPPPVHIEQVIADRKPYDMAVEGIQLPALTRDLEINYTALSLVAPEKNRFRVRLEGWDQDWQDVGTRRQAFYSSLPPRDYRFRVIASNNSGVWNETGAVLDFSIAPAYYQTVWFRTLAVATFLSLLGAAYRIRLRIIERHQAEITALNESLMKAQEQERTRIAGELHDGVMQQISALSLMLGTSRRKIRSDLEAKAEIRDVQEKLIQVGTEVRQLSHDLHPASLKDGGLPDALRAYCDEFSRVRGISVSCDADNAVRELSRGAALALYRIAQEALGNVVAHSAATRVDVRLTRTNGRVTLSVADDGKGFDPNRIGGSGGLGVINMRERARQLNGTFELNTQPGRGTTVRVAIPFR